MNRDTLKKSYLAAAGPAAGMIGAILFYAMLAEALRHLGHKPPLQPPAAYAAKYALYIFGLSPLLVLKLAAAKFSVKRATPEEALKGLTIAAIVTAALCELPAIAGLIMFLLTGFTADFYLLLAYSAGLEIYHFPRLSKWEERLRGEFGHYES